MADGNGSENTIGIDIPALDTRIDDSVDVYAAFKTRAYVLAHDFAIRDDGDSIVSLLLNPEIPMKGVFDGTGALQVLFLRAYL
ncbi:hypothetical protein F5Y15DRAFT_417408 [Xylariaceae sp. FL0016]|nr:hypothetical protein F5Y15DRAFT_417408 [Xylariaceae sp. FL0016]